MLQEASTDGFCSFVISSPIKESDFNENLRKKEWSKLVLYPSGFTIVPDMNLCISISLQLMDSTQQDAIKAMQQFHLDLIDEIEQVYICTYSTLCCLIKQLIGKLNLL